MRNIIYLIFTISIWILSATFVYFYNRGAMNVSPWGMHNFTNITLQIAIILLPIIGLILSILIRRKIKYVMILGCFINIYFLTVPFILFWLHYFKVI